MNQTGAVPRNNDSQALIGAPITLPAEQNTSRGSNGVAGGVSRFDMQSVVFPR